MRVLDDDLGARPCGLREHGRKQIDRLLRLGAGDRVRILQLAPESDPSCERPGGKKRPGDDDEQRPPVGEAAETEEQCGQGSSPNQCAGMESGMAEGASRSPRTVISAPRRAPEIWIRHRNRSTGEQVGGAAESDPEAHLVFDRSDVLFEVARDQLDLGIRALDDGDVDQRRRLVDEDVDRRAVLQKKVDEALEELGACCAAALQSGEPDLAEDVVELIERGRQHRLEQCLLRGEVVQHGRLGDAGAVADLLQRGAEVSGGGELLEGDATEFVSSGGHASTLADRSVRY